MIKLGVEIGSTLKGGEVLELIGDVGAGKTTFTKGLAQSIGIKDSIQSPTFTISRFYEGDKLNLVHYDFYRLSDPGIMQIELSESLEDENNIVVIEWAEGVSQILPEDRIRIEIVGIDEISRKVAIEGWK